MRGLFIRSGFMCLLIIVVSVPVFAQERGAGARGTQGARGSNGTGQSQGGTRGGQGNSEELAAKRQEIQSQQKAAMEQENRAFKDTMNRIQSDRKSATSDVERDLLKARTADAQRHHQAALQKIRSDGQAAMAALKQ